MGFSHRSRVLNMKNIVLVGFMGTGKTEVAKALAKGLGMKYVSTDELIVEKDGRAITDIFKKDGEAYFRQLEKKVVAEVSRLSGQVIDTGGGVVLNDDNLRALRANGHLVCLWASPEAIYERTCRHGYRPLLNVDDPQGKIRELLESRKPCYEKADLHVNTTGLDIGEVAESIRRMINENKE